MSDKRIHAQLLLQGVIPVLRAETDSEALNAAAALADGGLKALEVTMTMPDPEAVLRTLSRDSTLLPGAGTVMNVDEAARCLEAGAQFIVSPVFDEEVCAICRKTDVPYYPGALTPNEIQRALRAGATMVKVFPVANFGGVSYLKSLRSPWPGFECMVSGGVDLNNLGEYFKNGARLIGAGSSLVKPDLMKTGQWSELTKLAQAYVEAFHRCRQPAPSQVWT